MHIQNNVDHSVVRRNFAPNRTVATSTSKDFFNNFVHSDESGRTLTEQMPVSRASVPQKEISPIQLYEQMKGASDVARSSKEVKGVKWTDETLAMFARKDGAKVDTTKAVNWNATGEHTLTEAELDELRKKYDLENLSGQDFYDLMADLSSLNAISAEDIHGMFFKQAAPMGLYPSGMGVGGSSFIKGDIFNALEKELDSISQMKGFLLSDEFWLMNLSVGKDEHQNYMGYLDSRASSMGKLYKIFSNIRG